MADIPSTPADGTLKVLWVPAIADPSAPTLAELTAVSVVDVSCYLTKDGWVPGLSENTITDDRLCDTQTYEKPGSHSRSLQIKYVENPGSLTYNKAYDTFVPLTAGFFVARKGMPYDTALAAAQKVWVWPSQMGQRDPLPPEKDSVMRVQQKVFITGRTRTDVAIAT